MLHPTHLLQPTRHKGWSPRHPRGVVVRLPRPAGGRTAIGYVATTAGALSSSCRAPIDVCCCFRNSPGVWAVSTVPMVIHAGVVVSRLRPTGTGLRDSCRWSPPGVGADPLIPALVHAGAVILRPRPTGGGTTTKRVAAVTGGRPSPCCTLLISCNPPVTRADPLVIHAGVVVRLLRPTGGRVATGRVATIAGALSSSCRAPIDGCCCCCSSLGACAVSTVPMVIHAGVVVRRSRPTGTGLRDSCRWSPPGVGADPLVPALVNAGVVILRPRPTDGGTTDERVAAVTGGRPSPCCTPPISCNPPVTRADPLIIHAGVVVHLPRPTGGRAATGGVATIAGALSSSCRAPIDGYCCCCSSLGACAVSPVPMVINAEVVVRRPRPTDAGTAAGCVATGRTPSCFTQSNSCCCRVPAARAAIVVRRSRPIGGVTAAECAMLSAVTGPPPADLWSAPVAVAPLARGLASSSLHLLIITSS